MEEQKDQHSSLVKTLSRKRSGLKDDQQPSEEMMDETEKLVTQFMNSMWDTYDVNKSGFLEKDQAQVFLKDIFQECTGDIDGIEITDEDLDMLFEDIDLDSSGKISKDEFRKLIRDSTGL